MSLATRWRIAGVPQLPQSLNVYLTVDTTAPAVISAVEQAAYMYGIALVREEEPDDARPAR